MVSETKAAALQDHRAEQRRRIIAAAAVCFSRDGFHGTSMQQICAEAEMSPGALYRYFPSKESLIGAIVEGERADNARVMDEMEAAPTLVEGLGAALGELLAADGCNALKPEIMAEAIRNQPLRETLEALEGETHALLMRLLETARARGEIDPALDLETLYMFLHIIGDGMVLHNLLHPEWRLQDRTGQIMAMIQRLLAPAAERTA